MGLMPDNKPVVVDVSDPKNNSAVIPDPTVGTNETHINVFKQDVLDALKQAHAVLNEAELKYQALLNKLGL